MEFRIRPVRLSDAADINELRCMSGVFENLLALPSERLEYQQRFLDNLGDNDYQFVAEVQQFHTNGAQEEAGKSRVVAMAGLQTGAMARRRHCAGIGIMVHKDYQSQGIGRGLMEKLVDLADNWLMLVRLELTVYTDNSRAIALYESVGFEKEGVARCAAIKNGKYADELMMGRIHPRQSMESINVSS